MRVCCQQHHAPRLDPHCHTRQPHHLGCGFWLYLGSGHLSVPGVYCAASALTTGDRNIHRSGGRDCVHHWANGDADCRGAHLKLWLRGSGVICGHIDGCVYLSGCYRLGVLCREASFQSIMLSYSTDRKCTVVVVRTVKRRACSSWYDWIRPNERTGTRDVWAS